MPPLPQSDLNYLSLSISHTGIAVVSSSAHARRLESELVSAGLSTIVGCMYTAPNPPSSSIITEFSSRCLLVMGSIGGA